MKRSRSVMSLSDLERRCSEPQSSRPRKSISGPIPYRSDATDVGISARPTTRVAAARSFDQAGPLSFFGTSPATPCTSSTLRIDTSVCQHPLDSRPSACSPPPSPSSLLADSLRVSCSLGVSPGTESVFLMDGEHGDEHEERSPRSTLEDIASKDEPREKGLSDSPTDVSFFVSPEADLLPAHIKPANHFPLPFKAHHTHAHPRRELLAISFVA